MHVSLKKKLSFCGITYTSGINKKLLLLFYVIHGSDGVHVWKWTLHKINSYLSTTNVNILQIYG